MNEKPETDPKLTAEQLTHYWTHVGFCPKCGKDDGLYYDTIEVESETAQQQITCKCGAEFTELYDLSAVDVDGTSYEREDYDPNILKEKANRETKEKEMRTLAEQLARQVRTLAHALDNACTLIDFAFKSPAQSNPRGWRSERSFPEEVTAGYAMVEKWQNAGGKVAEE